MGTSRAAKLIRGDGRNAEIVGAVQTGKRRLWSDLIVALQYLKGAYKKNEEELFTRAGSDRTRGKDSS